MLIEKKQLVTLVRPRGVGGIAEQRDPKGLYLKARRGELANFTGIDSPYEAPESPELTVDTTTLPPEDAADAIIDYLRRNGYIA